MIIFTCYWVFSQIYRIILILFTAGYVKTQKSSSALSNITHYIENFSNLRTLPRLLFSSIEIPQLQSMALVVFCHMSRLGCQKEKEIDQLREIASNREDSPLTIFFSMRQSSLSHSLPNFFFYFSVIFFRALIPFWRITCAPTRNFSLPSPKIAQLHHRGRIPRERHSLSLSLSHPKNSLSASRCSHAPQYCNSIRTRCPISLSLSLTHSLRQGRDLFRPFIARAIFVTRERERKAECGK